MVEPGDSREQKEAERYLVNSLSKKMGVVLEKTSFDLEEGKVELDGFCKYPLVLCEARAHIGPPKSAQKDKVMADAFKLVFVDTTLMKGKSKRILLFADSEAAAPFRGKTWMAKCLKEFNVLVEVLELPPEMKDEVFRAQV